MKVCRVLANLCTFHNFFISNRDLLESLVTVSSWNLCSLGSDDSLVTVSLRNLSLASLAGASIDGSILSQVQCMVQVLVCHHHGWQGRLVELCIVLSWSFSHLPLPNVGSCEWPLTLNVSPAVQFPIFSWPSILSRWLKPSVKIAMDIGTPLADLQSQAQRFSEYWFYCRDKKVKIVEMQIVEMQLCSCLWVLQLLLLPWCFKRESNSWDKYPAAMVCWECAARAALAGTVGQCPWSQQLRGRRQRLAAGELCWSWQGEAVRARGAAGQRGDTHVSLAACMGGSQNWEVP